MLHPFEEFESNANCRNLVWHVGMHYFLWRGWESKIAVKRNDYKGIDYETLVSLSTRDGLERILVGSMEAQTGCQ